MIGIEWTSGPATIAAAPEYIAGANASFPGGWGDDRLFRWAFLEPRAGRTGVLIVARQGGDAIAGTGVTFRLVAHGGTQVLAAIMTGSWTKPGARGQGLFGSMIQRSVAVAQAAGAELLLAFVTNQNASRRRLDEAGATLFPSAYCLGPVDAPVVVEPLRPVSFAPHRESTTGAATFAYADEEWRLQFLHRPTIVPVVVMGHDTAGAVVEQGDRQHLVHAVWGEREASLLVGLAAEAASRQRRLFCFTTRVDLWEALAQAGFDVVSGSIAAISTGARSVVDLVQSWDLVNGDRL